jgi:arylsulfatase A-like enzyme
VRACIAALVLGAVGPAWAGPVACTQTTTANCCANLPSELLDCSVPPQNQLTQRNILFIVSDDQGYCSYRFLREPKDVSGNDFPDNVGTAVPGAEDLTCRYRNPEDALRDEEAFPFNRGTHEPMAAGSDFIGVRTPTLDRLAKEGAVFPRAHLGANLCDPSLSVLFVGKYLKNADVAYVRRKPTVPGNRDFRTCECRYTNETCGRTLGGQDDSLDKQCVEPPDGCTTGTCVGNKCVWTNVPAMNGVIDCTPETQNADCANPCEDVRTVTRLLNEAPIRSTGEGYYTLAGPKSYQTQGIVGATPKKQDPDFVLINSKSTGRFGCTNRVDQGENCNEAIRAPCPDPGEPCPPLKVRKSLQRVTDFISSVPLHKDRNSGSNDGHLWQPFFLMYSPNLPHAGYVPTPFFREHFCLTSACSPPSSVRGKRAKIPAKYYANVEALDYGLSALVKHLKRSCVCENGQKKSLYDTTIIAFLTDNGWMLPKSKGTQNTDDLAGENGFRTPLIVSLPEHRLPPSDPAHLAPAVFTDQLVHATDVTRTLLAYADNGSNKVRIPWDLKGTDLRPVIANPGSAAPVRDVLVGQWSVGQNVEAIPDRWFLVTRPGLVGVCIDGTGSPGATTTFCLEDTDCPTSGGPWQCRTQDQGEAKSKVCMNRPAAACDTDDDCDEGLCPSTPPFECRVPDKNGTSGPPDKYGFKDFEQVISCASGGDQQCRPAGVCQPPVLRHAVKGSHNGSETSPSISVDPQLPERVYLLTSDPDETTDLSNPAEGLQVPLGVRGKLRDCMARWEVWKPGVAPSLCGSTLNLKYGG